MEYGAVCVVLRLAVLVQCRLVTDGRTYNDSICSASIASHGKKTGHETLTSLIMPILRVICHPYAGT